MVFILKCDLGTRIYPHDFKVLSKKDSDLIELWASELKPKDTILWESERLVAARKKMFLEELGRLDPALRKRLCTYEKIGAYYEKFRFVCDKMSKVADIGDLLDEISKAMKRKHANATSTEALFSWLSEENAPWLPQEQKDLVILASVLTLLARQYRIEGVKREIYRIKKMGSDPELRNLVGKIRGRRRSFGRSIGPRGRSRSIKGIQKIERDTERRKEHVSHAVDFADRFNEAERRSLKRFEAWVKELPSEELAQWAVVKAPLRSTGAAKKSEKPRKKSMKGFPTFRDGPLLIRNRRQVEELKRKLGYSTSPELQSEWPAIVIVDFAGTCLPASFRFAINSPSIIDSIEGDQHVHLQMAKQTPNEVTGTLTARQPGRLRVVTRQGEETWTQVCDVAIKPIAEWNAQNQGTVELRVNLSGECHWSVPSSSSFELIDETTMPYEGGVLHRLRVIPLQHSVVFPESYIQCLGSRYVVGPFEWSPTFELPEELNLSEMGSATLSTKAILHAYYLSRIGIARQKTGEALTNSLHGLDLIKAANPRALDEAIWKAIDIVRGKLGSSLHANLVIAEWWCSKLWEALRSERI